MAETWFLAWPDAVEPLTVDFTRIPTVEEFNARQGSRGPFPTRELAEEARYQDHVPSYWAHGLAVYADHCLTCGKYASVLAGDWSGDGFCWMVTDCRTCGVTDSRNLENSESTHWVIRHRKRKAYARG